MALNHRVNNKLPVWSGVEVPQHCSKSVTHKLKKVKVFSSVFSIVFFLTASDELLELFLSNYIGLFGVAVTSVTPGWRGAKDEGEN